MTPSKRRCGAADDDDGYVSWRQPHQQKCFVNTKANNIFHLIFLRFIIFYFFRLAQTLWPYVLRCAVVLITGLIYVYAF